MRPQGFILTDKSSCRLKLAYFAGKIPKNSLVYKNVVALAYYGSCRLLVMDSVLGHYLFLEAHSFPRATLSENCSQIMSADKYPSIVSRQMQAIVYIMKS